MTLFTKDPSPAGSTRPPFPLAGGVARRPGLNEIGRKAGSDMPGGASLPGRADRKDAAERRFHQRAGGAGDAGRHVRPRNDSLDAARGLVNGAVISLIVWTVAVAALWLLH